MKVSAITIAALTIAGLLIVSPTGASAQAPTDPQIAHIVVTANQVCLWKALQLVGSTSVPTQYGRIFTLSR